MDEPKLTLPFLYKKNKGKKNAGRKSCGQEEEDQSKSSAWKRRSLPEGSSGAGACGSGGELGGDDEFSFGAYKNSRGKAYGYRGKPRGGKDAQGNRLPGWKGSPNQPPEKSRGGGRGGRGGRGSSGRGGLSLSAQDTRQPRHQSPPARKSDQKKREARQNSNKSRNGIHWVYDNDAEDRKRDQRRAELLTAVQSQSTANPSPSAAAAIAATGNAPSPSSKHVGSAPAASSAFFSKKSPYEHKKEKKERKYGGAPKRDIMHGIIFHRATQREDEEALIGKFELKDAPATVIASTTLAPIPAVILDATPAPAVLLVAPPPTIVLKREVVSEGEEDEEGFISLLDDEGEEEEEEEEGGEDAEEEVEEDEEEEEEDFIPLQSTPQPKKKKELIVLSSDDEAEDDESDLDPDLVADYIQNSEGDSKHYRDVLKALLGNNPEPQFDDEESEDDKDEDGDEEEDEEEEEEEEEEEDEGKEIEMVEREKLFTDSVEDIIPAGLDSEVNVARKAMQKMYADFEKQAALKDSSSPSLLPSTTKPKAEKPEKEKAITPKKKTESDEEEAEQGEAPERRRQLTGRQKKKEAKEAKKKRKQLKKKNQKRRGKTGADMRRVNRLMRGYLEDDEAPESLPLPYMAKDEIHNAKALAHLYNFRTKVMASGRSTFLVISKTKKTDYPDLKLLSQLMDIIAPKPQADPEQRQAKKKKQSQFASKPKERRGGKGRGGGGGGGGVTMGMREGREGQIVGDLAPPIETENIGNQMLRKMGWIGGSLGSAGDGIVEPISVTIKLSRRGLGFD